jgi:hypothetical protein
VVTWRPPSARNKSDGHFDQLHEGVPSWLAPPLIAWVDEFIVHHSPMGGVYFDTDVIHRIEMAVRFDPPLPTSSSGEAADSIAQRFRDNSPQGIDVLDHLLHRLPPVYSWQAWDGPAVELKRILDEGGSVWDVTTGEEGDTGARYELTRRVAGPMVEAIQELGSTSERAGHHLREAWTQLLGTHPDPSAAYQAAVQAVEVAAKPVVSPNNATATLGHMRGQLRADQRDQPGRWTFELGDFQVVLDMISALWESQLRHGDEAAPVSETQQQADAAVFMAFTLVRWFTTGAVRPT